MTEQPALEWVSRTVYVAVGNSDDRLSQELWAKFVHLVVRTIESYAQRMHGVWFSAPDSPFQNACVCLQLDSATAREELRGELTRLRMTYGQEAVAWTEFTGAAEMI